MFINLKRSWGSFKNLSFAGKKFKRISKFREHRNSQCVFIKSYITEIGLCSYIPAKKIIIAKLYYIFTSEKVIIKSQE